MALILLPLGNEDIYSDNLTCSRLSQPCHTEILTLIIICVHCRMCSFIPGLWPTGASSTFLVVTTKNYSGHCQISLGKQNHPHLRATISRDIFIFYDWITNLCVWYTTTYIYHLTVSIGQKPRLMNSLSSKSNWAEIKMFARASFYLEFSIHFEAHWLLTELGTFYPSANNVYEFT